MGRGVEGSAISAVCALLGFNVEDGGALDAVDIVEEGMRGWTVGDPAFIHRAEGIVMNQLFHGPVAEDPPIGLQVGLEGRHA